MPDILSELQNLAVGNVASGKAVSAQICLDAKHEIDQLRTIIATHCDSGDATTVDAAVIRLCFQWWEEKHEATAKGGER